MHTAGHEKSFRQVPAGWPQHTHARLFARLYARTTTLQVLRAVFTNDAMEPYFFVHKELDNMTTELIDALVNAMNSGKVVAIALWSISWMFMFVNFRLDSLALRKGDWTRVMVSGSDLLQRSEGSIGARTGLPGPSDACAFAGQQVATATIAYVLILAITFIVTFLLWFEPIRKFLWSFLPTLITILTPVLITMIFKKIFGYMWFANNFTIKHFRWWTLYDIAMIYATAFTGLVSGAVRALIALGATVVAVNRLDVDVLPEWVNSLLPLDAPHKSYKAMLMMHHYGNCPVFIMFEVHTIRTTLSTSAIGLGLSQAIDISQAWKRLVSKSVTDLSHKRLGSMFSRNSGRHLPCEWPGACLPDLVHICCHRPHVSGPRDGTHRPAPAQQRAA